MPNPIKLRRSYTANSVPLVSDLEENECAINWTDGKIFVRRNNAIVTLTLGGGGGGGALSGSVTIPGLGDPYFSNVSLLLHMDGTGITFVDSSGTPKTITAVGNATQSSTQSQFGGKSLYLDGTDDRLTASSADFAFGTGDFCIEFAIRPTTSAIATSGARGPLQISDVSGGLSTSYSSGVVIVFGDSGVAGVNGVNGGISCAIGGTFFGSGTSAVVAADQWNHIAVTRQSGTGRLYCNGALIASATATANLTGQHLCIGGYYDPSFLISGYIDEVRITKGVSRFATSTITVPTAAYSADLTLPVTITGSGGSGSGLTWSTVPASATASGTAGQIAYDDANGFFYVATATNVWKRAALSTWAPFTPASVTGLQLWLDASDASTLYDATSGGSLVAADGTVARWEDKSGNARHATQSTSGDRPVRKTSVQNGKDVIRFDGSGDFIDSTNFLDLTTGQSLTICAVVKRANTGSTHAIVSKYGKSDGADGNTADGWGMRLLSDNKFGFFGSTNEGAGLSSRVSDATVSASAFTVLTVKASAGALSSATLYRQSSLVASSATATGAETLEATSYGVTIGALRYTFNASSTRHLQFFDGDIAEVCIYNASLGDTDRAAVESYLVTKWGLS